MIQKFLCVVLEFQDVLFDLSFYVYFVLIYINPSLLKPQFHLQPTVLPLLIAQLHSFHLFIHCAEENIYTFVIIVWDIMIKIVIA
jgi:hypothetical protein